MIKKRQEWRDIPGYEGYFMVSNIGHVFNVQKHKKCKLSNVKGYKVVSVYNQNGKTLERVHRLVALAFVDNPESKPHVNHLNGVRWDNRVENLEWCTHLENMQHANANGLYNKSSNPDNVNLLINEEYAKIAYGNFYLEDTPYFHVEVTKEPKIKFDVFACLKVKNKIKRLKGRNKPKREKKRKGINTFKVLSVTNNTITEMYDLEGVAALLGILRADVLEMVHAGTIEAEKLGRVYGITEKEFLRVKELNNLLLVRTKQTP